MRVKNPISLCKLNFFTKEKQKRQEVIDTQAETLLATRRRAPVPRASLSEHCCLELTDLALLDWGSNVGPGLVAEY